VSNRRTDEYGGSIENRARFPLEIVEAVSNAIGAQKTAIRFSPWGRFQGIYHHSIQLTGSDIVIADMGMKHPIPQFSYIVRKLVEDYSSLAYVHLVEPRVIGFMDIEIPEGESNDFIRKLWTGPLITAGGYHRSLAIEVTDKNPNELIAFTRYFIANVSLAPS
jgi:NADPH2 dehydrogenase